MRKLMVMALALFLALTIQAQKIKPYVLGAVSDVNMAETKKVVKQNLTLVGFKIIGEYQAAKDANRWLMVVTSDDLLNAVKTKGGLQGFAAALRVAITVEGGVVNISYTNPTYWGNAYFGDDFPSVSSSYQKVSNQFIIAMKKCGKYSGVTFGSKSGITPEDLREYQYMMGMPEFDDVVTLATFDSFQAAKQKIDAKIKAGVAGLKLIYAIEIPGKNIMLYGIALTGNGGEADFLPTIDISSPKHTAFLPYEILVNNKEVVMLHGRYRIAVSFPDLSMSTFTKIMSTPGDIEKFMALLCK
jgi:hypothetical protein